MVQFNASPTIIDISIARRFITGSVPGSAATIGSTKVFGSAEKKSGCATFAARVNIFDLVANSTWISKPTISLEFEMLGRVDAVIFESYELAKRFEGTSSHLCDSVLLCPTRYKLRYY